MTTAPDFPVRHELADGSVARIRPVEPSDKALLEEGLEHLSRESRYRRFLSPMPELSDRQLAYLTEVDGKNHVALIARVSLDGVHVGGGVGRYVRDPDEPETAEFALTVTDALQNKGLGSHLLDLLLRVGRANGLQKLVGLVQRDNLAMLAVLEKFGAKRGVDGSLLRIELPLVSHTSH